MLPSSSSDAMIIVGAGHTAGILAFSLRDHGWQGPIVMIGQEPHLPYQRPPLSKAFLAGELDASQLLIKPQAAYDKASITFMPQTQVDKIDRPTQTVHLSDGRILAYAGLALATGGRPRPLAVPDHAQAEQQPNFHYLRTLDDVQAIRPQFRPGARLVIIGGGYIGLEVAAIAIQQGLQVTVLEAQPRVLARVTAPEISAFYARVHREAGVDLRTGVECQRFEYQPDTGISAVLCSDDSRIAADLVIVGVGLLPNTELASAAGLVVENGIVVDEYARTTDPRIVAAGDCSNHPNALYGRLRLESVPNAMEQARTAAASLCGQMRPYQTVPWFWSDQYDLKLKMVGLSQGYDQLVLRGNMERRAFCAFYLKEGRLLAVDTVSQPQDFMVARRLIAESIPVTAAQLADDTLPLKSLLPAPSA